MGNRYELRFFEAFFMMLIGARAITNFFEPSAAEVLISFCGVPCAVLWLIARRFHLTMLRLLTVVFVFYVLLSTDIVLHSIHGDGLFFFLAITVGHGYVLWRLKYQLLNDHV